MSKIALDEWELTHYGCILKTVGKVVEHHIKDTYAAYAQLSQTGQQVIAKKIQKLEPTVADFQALKAELLMHSGSEQLIGAIDDAIRKTTEQPPELTIEEKQVVRICDEALAYAEKQMNYTPPTPTTKVNIPVEFTSRCEAILQRHLISLDPKDKQTVEDVLVLFALRHIDPTDSLKQQVRQEMREHDAELRRQLNVGSEATLVDWLKAIGTICIILGLIWGVWSFTRFVPHEESPTPAVQQQVDGNRTRTITITPGIRI